MGKFILLLKFLANVLLYCFYSLVSIIIGNFMYGAYMAKVLELPVPGPEDIIHKKIAIFILVVVLIFTLLFRGFFYLSLFKNKKGN